MRVLAIGATGFIGRHVVNRLRDAGHDVCVFHRGNTKSTGAPEILGDRAAIADLRPRFRDWSPDVVLDMILSSAVQARATLDAFRGIARRVVVASSGDVYRAMAVLHRLEPGPVEPVPLTEDSPLRTQGQTYSQEALAAAMKVIPWLDSEYDKIQVERVIASEPALPSTILRLPMVYGPGDPLHRLYPMVKRAQDGRPILLDQTFAQWTTCRGYVENVAEAIALAVVSEKAAGRIYNLGEPEPRTEAQVAAKIGRVVVLPRERTPAHLLKPGNFEQHLFTSTARIRGELGYAESISVDDALRRTVQWERENPPPHIDSSQFDYAAEEQALRDIVVQ
jgi:nucleoside-diphosphate-sugar epimerase